MHAVRSGGFVTYGYPVSAPASPEERRPPGRPRKWASEAERVRAYRQRKAEEQADVDALRVERRALKRQLSDAVRGRRRAESALERERNRTERLQNELDGALERLRRSESQVEQLRSKVQELVAKDKPAPPAAATAPTLSREQRRAIERDRRQHGR